VKLLADERPALKEGKKLWNARGSFFLHPLKKNLVVEA